MTLKQILCMYAPHGVEALFIESGEVMVIDWIDVKTRLVGHKADYSREEEGEILTSHIDEVKLCLRPMSSITEEIEHNGERFVPLIRLAKLFYDRSTSKYKTTHFELGPTQDYFYDVKCCVENDSLRYVYYSICKDITLNDFRVVNQLIAWHFDVFGGIGKWALVLNKDI